MLDLDEADAVAEQFGVAHAQVQRDHLISHVLAALSAQVREQVVFFGGTALSRTYVPDGRLSEDIDLLAVGNRGRPPATSTTCGRSLRQDSSLRRPGRCSRGSDRQTARPLRTCTSNRSTRVDGAGISAARFISG